MSGEGFLAACPALFAAAIAGGAPEGDERGDMIAFLEQSWDNADTIAARWPGFEHEARVQRRQLDTLIGDVRAGMHEGAAGVRARLLATKVQGETPR